MPIFVSLVLFFLCLSIFVTWMRHLLRSVFQLNRMSPIKFVFVNVILIDLFLMKCNSLSYRSRCFTHRLCDFSKPCTNVAENKKIFSKS